MAGNVKRPHAPRAVETDARGTGPSRPGSRWSPPAWAKTVGRSAFRAYAWTTADLRPNPDFLIIGAKRSGTTSLFRYLLDHPQVATLFPSARWLPLAEDTKGVHYFDGNARRSARWYRSHFRTRVALGRGRGGRQLTGEASPFYLFRPGAAERAARTTPTSKLLVVLREPVSRAHSHWKEQTRNGLEHLAFGEAIAAEAERIAGIEERMRADPGLRDAAYEHLSYRLQSEYVRGLRPWLDRFPRQQLHVVWSDDLFGEPAATFAAICEFLGIDAVERATWERWNAAEADPIEPEAAAALRAHFDPLDRELAALLGQSPPWLTDPGAAP